MSAIEAEIRDGGAVPGRTGRRSKAGKKGIGLQELAWDIFAGLAFGVAAIGVMLAVASPIPEDPPRPDVLAAASWGAGAKAPDTITVRVTADGGLRTIVQASEIQMVVPKDATVTMLWNRLIDKYPILSPLVMLHTNNKMLPMNSLLKDGQIIALSR